MAFVLSTIMDAIASEAAGEISGIRTYGYPASDPVPPCMIVGYPTTLDYDLTFHAGGTTGKISAVFPVWYVVGKVIDKDARDKLSAVITGAPGIKESLDGNLAGAVDIANVKDVKVEELPIGEVPYLAARFELEVTA